MRSLLAPLVAVWSNIVVSSPGAAFLINNGSSPPSPANVVEGWENDGDPFLMVRNLDCERSAPEPCNEDSPTRVLADSPIFRFNHVEVRDTSHGDFVGLLAKRVRIGSSASAIAEGSQVYDLDVAGQMTVQNLNGYAYATSANGLLLVESTVTTAYGFFTRDSSSLEILADSQLAYEIVISDESTLVLTASEFESCESHVSEECEPIPFGEYPATSGHIQATNRAGTSTAAFYRDPTATLLLVAIPEPSTALLTALGLVRPRRKQRSGAASQKRAQW